MSEENKNINNEFSSENEENEKTEDTVSAEENEPTYKRLSYADSERYNAVFSQDEADDGRARGKKKKISLSAFIVSTVAVILVTVMITWSVCLGFYRKQLSDVIEGGLIGSGAPSGEIDLIASILEQYSYFDLEEEEMLEAAIKAYVAATGDRYAAYMTEEEFEQYNMSMSGNTVGVGINVIESSVALGGREYKVYKVINVTKGSPAEAAGVRAGDYIAYIGADKETRVSVDSVGYDEAFARMLGEEGTTAEFTVLRQKTGLTGEYDEIAFWAVRKKITTNSVYAHVCATDPSVGIVKITGFDYNTPVQFCEAVDGLRAKGIEKIVFDLRYNGGGALVSIVAILSYFLDEGDTVISTQSKGSEPKVTKVGVVRNLSGEKSGCNVPKEDIGKYKGLKTAVLCNSSTASAAELFTATFRDYKLGKIVGTTTFGKGAMQSILDLSYFGYEGGLKLTTDMYFPPCGESYDGEGIAPDVAVELDEALVNKNIYEITDAEDNQLQAAIKTFQ